MIMICIDKEYIVNDIFPDEKFNYLSKHKQLRLMTLQYVFPISNTNCIQWIPFIYCMCQKPQNTKKGKFTFVYYNKLTKYQPGLHKNQNDIHLYISLVRWKLKHIKLDKFVYF